ncbi:MAG: ABC transporter ATP-binding protein, partial [Candidatus Eremiobacteraeota bacterium]|nr:ABC transporter ATP-binding protein [Candidatus Eremiobacteraeota bacterium]
MARVRVANVSKSYRRGEVQVFALRDVSFALADGEFVAVIGPSGSGKTTLLRTIAGLTEPDAGSVWFDDRDVTNVPSQDRRAGFVFQQYALYPHLSVYENIAFGPRARRLAADLVAARVRAVSARARLGAE